MHKGRTTFEYLWRVGLRPLLWLLRVAAILWSIIVIAFAIKYTSEFSAFIFVLIYGIWEIGRSLRSIQPLHVSIAKGDTLVVENGATISVPKQDIDRLIETIGRSEAERKPQ